MAVKRFYKAASVRPADAIFAIVLDERPVRTPGGRTLALDSAALAGAIVAEWAGQGDEIDHRTMPLTQFANTAIDRVRADRSFALAQIEQTGRHDLVCYRADAPPELMRREALAWDQPLAWVRERHGLDLAVTAGIASIPQPDASFARLREELAVMDPFVLTGLAATVPILKSTVLALALHDGLMDARAAHAAAHVDEAFQAEKWGLDSEAETRLKALLGELETTDRFMRLARA
ncbi:MAG TPA: ATP12 family protein [Rhizomicrobium sp.]|jgi:chaperone required for assembly of F1-ATPase|nr:ATP12 family protein [Rhizomicrobium sp.]